MPAVRRVERYRYFARTMLDGRDFSARIEFCARPAFEQLFQELTKVHDFNCAHFNAQVQTFFESVLTTPDRRDALIPEFARRIEFHVSILGEIERPTGSKWVRLEWDGSVLKVLLSIDESAVTRLRQSKPFMGHLARIAREVYRYSGPVDIGYDDDIPF